MRQETVTVLTLNELKPEVKSKVIENYRTKSLDTSHAASEYYDTLEAFENAVGVKFDRDGIDFSYPRRVSFYSNYEDSQLNLSGIRLMKFIYNKLYNDLSKRKYLGSLTNSKKPFSHPCVKSQLLSRQKEYFNSYYSRITREMDNCPLTGVITDFGVLDPIIAFLKAPSDNVTLRSLLKDCVYQLQKMGEKEITYLESDQGIEEEIEGRELEFLENGKQWN